MSSKKDKTKVLEAAEKCMKSGKFQDAINEYERLMEGEPLDPNIANVIGDLYIRIGREDKAVKTFNEIAAFYEAKGLHPQCLAIFKKINKAVPEDVNSAVKLADLYAQLGFAAEAKAVYGQVADRLEKERHLKGLIFVYEKLVKIDRTDSRYRLKLADLYSKDGAFDEAVEELNEAAEIMIENQELGEAEKLLNQARTLKKGHVGTYLNLVSLLKKRKKTKEAIILMEEAVGSQRDNLELLSRLGSLYIDDENFRMGEEVFSRLYAKYPNDINIRIKLGYSLIQQNKVETAFQLYEPLINTLLSKGKEDKSVGLLGLIFTAREAYIPALEKLAVIYKSKEQKKNLELALRVLLQEYRRKGLKERMLVVLRELVNLCPDDRALAKEYANVGTAPSPSATSSSSLSGTRSSSPSATRGSSPSATSSPSLSGTRSAPAPPPQMDDKKSTKGFARMSEQDQEMIRINLNKADLFLQQGLIKNAHRILENLLLLYPNEARITQKIALVKEARAHIDTETIPELVEKASVNAEKMDKKEKPKEAAPAAPAKPEPIKPEPFKAEPARARPEPGLSADEIAKKLASLRAVPKLTPQSPGVSLSDKDRVTAAELFSTINIVVPLADRPRFKYYDLQERIAEEQALMEATYYQQFKKETAVVEKELADIIAEFRQKMDARPELDNADHHYNLGVAYLQQNLFKEAIEEFQRAAKDPSRAAECYSHLSHCNRKTGDMRAVREWLEKALASADPGSTISFAVKYEWGVFLEDMNEQQKAVPYYQEVKTWNPGFRDVSKRLRALKKTSEGRRQSLRPSE